MKMRSQARAVILNFPNAVTHNIVSHVVVTPPNP